MNQPLQLSLEEALRQAVTLHQAGRLQEAESWYRAILQTVPMHPDANHNLGLLLQQCEPAGAGLQYLQTAHIAVPDNPNFVLSYAAALQDDDPEQSLQILQGAIARGIVSPEIWCNLANLLRASGKLNEAKDALSEALRLRPAYAIAHFNLGSIEQDEKLFDAAAKSYRQAIRHQTGFAQAHNNLGMVLRELGDDAAVVNQFTAALVIDPQYAHAAFNLGQSLGRQGRFDQALVNYLWAAASMPEFVQAHNEAGLILLMNSESARAASLFQQALAVKPDFVAARVNLANALMTMQCWDEALGQVQQVIEQDADCAAAYHNLGTIKRHYNAFEEAETAYRKALAIEADFADAMLGLAAVVRYHSADETVALCRRALELRPGFAAAHVLLAECWSAQGRFAEAQAELRHAIVLEPAMPEAWSAIPALRKMTRGDASWLAYAQALAESGLPAEKEIYLRFALGKAFDDLAEYAKAFGQFSTANTMAKQAAQPYNRQAEERRANLICRDYTRDWIAASHAGVMDLSRPLFVLGMPRSGTSLVEQILAAHPMVAGAGELSYWVNASAQFSPFAVNGKEQRLPTDGELHALGKGYLDQLFNFDSNALRIVDKMPANFQCLGLIHAALPNARIIHVQRDPIDTCLSIYFQHFETYHNYANDLENLAHFYHMYRRLMSHWASVLPEASIMHLSYEELVQDQEAWTRKLLQFAGLPWDASCMQFQETERRVGTASNWQVRQPINRRSVERWRNYANELAPLIAMLDDIK